MKRSIAIIIIILSAISLKAQINPKLIYGDWVKVKVTYSDDVELPDVLPTKYTYIRYTFTNPDKVNISLLYSEQGLINHFLTKSDILSFYTASGFPINEWRIVKLTTDELVVVQKGQKGFDDPAALKLYFIPETVFQNNPKLYPNQVSVLPTGDTLYRESPKVYAIFKGNENLLEYLRQHRDVAGMDNQEGTLKASFIVFKTGVADSLKILHGINNDYDEQVIKWFNKNKKNWHPAKFNGKTVNVLKTIEQKYYTSSTMTPFTRYTATAYSALLAGDYEKALYYYNQSLTFIPDNVDNIYQRAVCKIILGISEGLCEDLTKVKAANTMLIDELINKYCPTAIKN